MKNATKILTLALTLFIGFSSQISAQIVQTCCSYQASMWFNDGISIDPVTGYQTNDIFEVVVNGTVLPLNYPYSIGSGAEMTSLIADINALGYNASYQVNNPSSPSLTYETIILFDAAAGDVLDAVNVYDVPTDLTSDFSCCNITPPPTTVEPCCGWTIDITLFSPGGYYAPLGLYINDFYELYIDGVLVPLNYPYNLENQNDLNSLIADLGALGYNATYTYPSGNQVRLIIEGGDGDFTVSSASVVCVTPTISSDFSCCIEVVLLQEPPANLQVENLFFEGLFNDQTNDMDWDAGISDYGFLPLEQPFNKAPWNYAGTESIDYVNPYIRDWCLVVIRDENNNIINQQACLIGRNGKLYNDDYGQMLFIDEVPAGDFTISIHQKSHLAVDKAVTNNVDNRPVADFGTFGNGIGFFIDPQYKIINGKPMLFAGDYDCNGVINNVDFNIWCSDNSLIDAYESFDADGNGVINNQDYNYWVANRSKVGNLSTQF